MIRLALAIMLLGAVCVLDAFTGRLPTTPISVELALGNPIAVGIFLFLAALLAYFARHCWLIQWKALSVVAIALIILLLVIAFTESTTRIHTMTFVAFVVLGIVWLIAYAEADCQRSISVLTILLLLAAFGITFILGVVDTASAGDAYEYWPVGLFQRGFLVALGILALRRSNQLSEQAGVTNVLSSKQSEASSQP